MAENTISTIAIQIRADTSKLSQDMAQASSMLKNAAPPDLPKSWMNIQRGFQGMRDSILETSMRMRPEYRREQAGLQLLGDKQRRQHDFLLQNEMRRQNGGRLPGEMANAGPSLKEAAMGIIGVFGTIK